jgi:hypothetical protein
MDSIVSIASLLWENRDVILQTAGGVVIIASLIVSGTNTPASDSILGKVYKVIEYAALNFGKAKQEAPKAE